MSNLLIFILGVLMSLPAGGGGEAALRERAREELGPGVKVSLRVDARAGAKSNIIVTFQNLETDAAEVERAVFTVPAPDSWGKFPKDERARAPRARFRLRLGDDALLGSMQQLNAGMAIEAIELRRKTIVVRGSVTAGGYPIPLRVEGTPKIEGDSLLLEVKKVSVFEITLPASVAGIFGGTAPTLLDLEETDIDYFVAEEADEALTTDFEPVIRKWELKKGAIEVSGYYKAEKQ